MLILASLKTYWTDILCGSIAFEYLNAVVVLPKALQWRSADNANEYWQEYNHITKNNTAHHSVITWKFNRLAIRLLRQDLNKWSSTWLCTLPTTDIFLMEQIILRQWISNYREIVEKKVSAKVQILQAKKKVQIWQHIAVFDSKSNQSGDNTSN